MNICKKALDLPPFIAMDVMERAQELARRGKEIIHLEVGEPDFDTPEVICDAAAEAMRAGRTHYTHSLGEWSLREAIAGHYEREYGVKVEPEQVIVTSGTSPAMLILFGALLEAGDEVVMSDPHYACYPNYINFLGGRPAKVRVSADDGFQLHVEAVKEKINDRTQAILINSPSNPTGQLLSAKHMEGLAGLDRLIVSDEIYHGLSYEGRARSILEFTDNAVVMNGFSKFYAMTGWRLGYLIVPQKLVRPIQKIHQNFFISANDFVQAGGVAALTLPQAREAAEEMARRYDARRKLMIGRLKELGLGIKVEPTGAFYVLANAKHLNPDSYKLAFDILEKALVGATPGIDFGEGAEGYLRFSYAASRSAINEGLDRLERYIKERS